MGREEEERKGGEMDRKREGGREGERWKGGKWFSYLTVDSS